MVSAPVKAILQTDVGQVRQTNQDFVAFREPAGADVAPTEGWLYILADGAGGMDAGDVASRYATEQTLKYYQENIGLEWQERLTQSLTLANRDLRELSAQHNGGSRMATTMVATIVHDDIIDIANVGDSRAYHFRAGQLRQLTKDQSLVAKLVDEGAITPEEAAVHPRRNVLLHSIGSDRTPQIDLYQQQLEIDDIMLLCSDGLTNHVPDSDIAMILADYDDPAEATDVLINLANERGGRDNISVILLRYVGEAVVDPAGTATTIYSKALWTYTLLLCLLQTILIFLVWDFLRV